MLLVGIDDTDVLHSPGTNQLAKALVATVADHAHCRLIVRHQLFFDPRVPYTSKNGSASLWLYPRADCHWDLHHWGQMICQFVTQHAAPGSDPGVCIAQEVPQEIVDFARQCQTAIVTQAAARHMAEKNGLFLRGLGGTHDGVIGALAAVGLAHTQQDGRVVMLDGRDDLSGWMRVQDLEQHGVVVRCDVTHHIIGAGWVDVGKKLRPNLCQREIVLWVVPHRPQQPIRPQHPSRPDHASSPEISDIADQPMWLGVKR